MVKPLKLPKPLLSKHDPCVFLGSTPTQKGFKVLVLNSYKTFVSRDVIFHELHFPFHNLASNSSSYSSHLIYLPTVTAPQSEFYSELLSPLEPTHIDINQPMSSNSQISCSSDHTSDSHISTFSDHTSSTHATIHVRTSKKLKDRLSISMTSIAILHSHTMQPCFHS